MWYNTVLNERKKRGLKSDIHTICYYSCGLARRETIEYAIYQDWYYGSACKEIINSLYQFKYVGGTQKIHRLTNCTVKFQST